MTMKIVCWILFGLLFWEADALQSPLPSSSSSASSGGGVTSASERITFSRLYFRNSLANDTHIGVLEPSSFLRDSSSSAVAAAAVQRRRDLLKRHLAVAAIEDYRPENYRHEASSSSSSTSSSFLHLTEPETHDDNNNNNIHDLDDDSSFWSRCTPEDLMRQLEPLCPTPHPACHADLNARWGFVFTGVPTIGMNLITLLSRLDVGLPRPFLDFGNVFLEVARQQTVARARVQFTVASWNMELQVHTALAPNVTDTSGTFFRETFQGLSLNGVPLWTPPHWRQGTRDLQITYMDDDLMIARTAGGEPHLLLRHSECSTDEDEECFIHDHHDHDDNEDHFDDHGNRRKQSMIHASRQIHGDRWMRRLVDRKFGSQNDQFQIHDVVQLIRSILHKSSSSSHGGGRSGGGRA